MRTMKDNKQVKTNNSILYNPIVTNSVIFTHKTTFLRDQIPPQNTAKLNNSNNRHSSQNKLKTFLSIQTQQNCESPIRRDKGFLLSPKLKKAHTSKEGYVIFSQRENKKQQNRTLTTIVPSFVKKKGTNKTTKSIRESEISNRFRKIKKLGEGKFGQVSLVVEQSTRMIFAMKSIQKKALVASGFVNQFIRQLKLQTFLKHPNIIQLYGFFNDQHNFYLLFELGCHGQLYERIQNTDFSEVSASIITRSILKSVEYMHQNKILHRDIKPENIVLVHGVVKMCDLGWAVNTQKEQLRGTFCGTPLYLSPEILSGQMYDEKVDLWAAGVLCFELIYKSSPFQIKNHKDLFKIITKPIVYPQKFTKPSKQLKEFIDAILTKNPKQRVSASELLKLQFISKYQGFDTCQQL